MPVKYKTQFIGKRDDNSKEVFDLALIDVSFSVDRAVVVNEIVDANGALLDDMGRKADVYNVRAAFIGSIDLGTDSPNYSTIERGESFFDFIRDYGTREHLYTQAAALFRAESETLSAKKKTN